MTSFVTVNYSSVAPTVNIQKATIMKEKLLVTVLYISIYISDPQNKQALHHVVFYFFDIFWG